jgi:hypothetical protein
MALPSRTIRSLTIFMTATREMRESAWLFDSRQLCVGTKRRLFINEIFSFMCNASFFILCTEKKRMNKEEDDL